MTDNKSIAVREDKPLVTAGFGSAEGFELLQRIGNAFSKSNLVPDAYKDNIGNCLIGVELAQRIGASPLMVMQNLHVIQGRPSFSSAFVISAINSCGRFSPLRFRVEDKGRKKIEYTYSAWNDQTKKKERKSASIEVHDFTCVAYAKDLADGEILEGPKVSIEMAVHEGWYTKPDSKWKTMPDVMLRYRAAAFFGRLYAPEILMGMTTQEEVIDVDHKVIDVTPGEADVGAKGSQGLNAGIAQATAARKRTVKPARMPITDVIDAETIDDAPQETVGDEAPPIEDDGDQIW